MRIEGRRVADGVQPSFTNEVALRRAAAALLRRWSLLQERCRRSFRTAPATFITLLVEPLAMEKTSHLDDDCVDSSK